MNHCGVKKVVAVGFGFSDAPFMKKLWQEIRDAALVERRGIKKWWM